jgi:hypothetical protein
MRNVASLHHSTYFGLAVGLIRIVFPLGIPSLGIEPVNSPSGRTPAAPKMVKREISKLVAHRTQESSEAKF